MKVTTGQIVSVTEANQNFSAVARKVDARGRGCSYSATTVRHT